MKGGLRLAMWSGPRNISTALMRAWSSRADTVVCDEPLYAHYLQATGIAHPGADEIIRLHDTDWRRVVARLAGPVPGGRRIHYQKHMAHHLLPEVGRDWLDAVTHAFLIREPGEMLTSLLHHLPEPTLADTGLPQQVEIFERVAAAGGTRPPVVDARDVLDNPEAMLRRLCAAVGAPFDAAMLRWRPGPRDTDGVWGKHWYDAVYRTTRFRPYRRKDETVPARFADLHARCRELYEKLHAHRLTVPT